MLTAEQLTFFREQGYLLVPGVVPQANCRAVVDAIFEFLGFDRNRPEEWYRPPLKQRNGGMVEMYHHQSQWDNRQLPQVYEMFRDLFGEKQLAVGIDRVSMKLPESPAHPDWADEGFVHLDVDPRSVLWAKRQGIQGVIYLTDTDETMGGFRCVPGFHKKIKAWALAPENERTPEPPDFSKEQAIYIPGKAGDYVVWDFFLPHGNGRNLSNRPRFAQYLTMSLAAGMDEATRQDRIRRWRDRVPTFIDESKHPHQPTGEAPAVLTPLGRKLIGMDPW